MKVEDDEIAVLQEILHDVASLYNTEQIGSPAPSQARNHVLLKRRRVIGRLLERSYPEPLIAPEPGACPKCKSKDEIFTNMGVICCLDCKIVVGIELPA